MIGDEIKQLLLIEDNFGDARLLREMLKDSDSPSEIQSTHVTSMGDAERHLAVHAVDIILLDLGLTDAQGLDAIQRVHKAAPRAALVVLTGLDDRSLAIQALKEGAQDYLIKGEIETRGLLRALRYAVERKSMEKDLFEEKERAQVTLASIGDAVVCTDTVGNISFLNFVAERMSGWTLREALGRPLTETFQVLDVVEPEADTDLPESSAGSGRPAGPRRTLVRRNGDEIPIETTVAPIHDREGQTIGAAIVLRDVSTAHEMMMQIEDRTRSLHRTMEILRQIIESSPVAIVNLNSDTEITTWNRRAEEIFGYAANEAIGRRYEEMLGVVDGDALGDLTEVLTGRMIRGVEIERKRKNGTVVVLSVAAGALTDRKNVPIGIVVLFEDITQAKATQIQLQHVQKMEVVGRLSGGIAHDFNNLLSVIIGNMDSLLLRLKPSRELEMAKQTMTAALRCAELTKQMLAFARRQPLDPTEIDVGTMLRNLSAIFERMLGEMVDVQTSTPDIVWSCTADRDQLESALLNLAVNARDAMPDGGTLTAKAVNVHLDSDYCEQNPDATPGDYVRLSVADTGCGMSPELLSRVIEPFFTTKDPGKGTGLGLSMVDGFAKQSGGHLKICSEEGNGTTANLYLPRAAKLEPTIGPGGDRG